MFLLMWEYCAHASGFERGKVYYSIAIVSAAVMYSLISSCH